MYVCTGAITVQGIGNHLRTVDISLLQPEKNTYANNVSNFKDANDKEVYGSEKLGFSVTIYLFIMNVVQKYTMK